MNIEFRDEFGAMPDSFFCGNYGEIYHINDSFKMNLPNTNTILSLIHKSSTLQYFTLNVILKISIFGGASREKVFIAHGFIYIVFCD